MNEIEQQQQILEIIKNNLKAGKTKSGKPFGIAQLESIYQITRDSEFEQYSVLKNGIEKIYNIAIKQNIDNKELINIKNEVDSINKSVAEYSNKSLIKEEGDMINKLSKYLYDLKNTINKIEVGNVKGQ